MNKEHDLARLTQAAILAIGAIEFRGCLSLSSIDVLEEDLSNWQDGVEPYLLEVWEELSEALDNLGVVVGISAEREEKISNGIWRAAKNGSVSHLWKKHYASVSYSHYTRCGFWGRQTRTEATRKCKRCLRLAGIS